MKNIYTVTLKRQMNEGYIAWASLVTVPLFTGLFIYYKGANIEKSLIFMLIGFILVLLFVLPALIVHFNYLMPNRRDSLQVIDASTGFIFKHNNRELNFSKEQINRIELYKRYEFGSPFTYPWGYYGHAIVYLRDGKSFVLTSLLYPYEELGNLSSNIKINTRLYRSGFGLQKYMKLG